jgi:nucleotide-binding universal stress UspA family protein
LPPGSAAEVFLDVSAAPVFLARSDHSALIVPGAKGHDLGDTMLGAVAPQVAGHARCPVVIVGHMPAGHRTAVVGTDGSPEVQAALGFAFGEAALRGSRFEVITVVGPPPHAPPGVVPPDLDEPLAQVHVELKEQLEPLRALARRASPALEQSGRHR